MAGQEPNLLMPRTTQVAWRLRPGWEPWVQRGNNVVEPARELDAKLDVTPESIGTSTSEVANERNENLWRMHRNETVELSVSSSRSSVANLAARTSLGRTLYHSVSLIFTCRNVGKSLEATSMSNRPSRYNSWKQWRRVNSQPCFIRFWKDGGRASLTDIGMKLT